MIRFSGIIFLMAGILSVASARASVEAPDWAERMAGKWRGAGERVDLASGQRTKIEVEVDSQWRSELVLPALVSKNRFSEITLAQDGSVVRSRQYDRIYWIRELQRNLSQVELALGAGEDSSSAEGSRGSYDSQLFLLLVQQDLGTGSRISSRSDLSTPGLTQYEELFWWNGRKRARSEIRYERVASAEMGNR
ncbi:MAG: hypothetical protein RJB38_1247 [Pseudomonadota bacterium]|jgi:hypothetical protein